MWKLDIFHQKQFGVQPKLLVRFRKLSKNHFDSKSKQMIKTSVSTLTMKEHWVVEISLFLSSWDLVFLYLDFVTYNLQKSFSENLHYHKTWKTWYIFPQLEKKSYYSMKSMLKLISRVKELSRYEGVSVSEFSKYFSYMFEGNIMASLHDPDRWL